MTRTELNDALLQAHKRAELNPESLYELVNLYHLAFEQSVAENAGAGYFYLTNAYVYALDSNHEKVEVLEGLLQSAGRL